MLGTVLAICNPSDVSLAKNCDGEYDYINTPIEQVQGTFESNWELIDSYQVPEDCYCNKGKVTIPNSDPEARYMIILTGLGSHVRYDLGSGYETNLETTWQVPECLTKLYTINVYKSVTTGGELMGGRKPITELQSSSEFPYPLLGLPLLGLPFALSGGGSDTIPPTTPLFGDDKTTIEDITDPREEPPTLPEDVTLAMNPLDNPNITPTDQSPLPDISFPDPDNPLDPEDPIIDPLPVPFNSSVLHSILAITFLTVFKLKK